MRLIFVFIFLLCGIYETNAQQSKDTLAALYKPYQSAMGILLKSERAMPQDSIVLAQEWQWLHNNYKRISDSLNRNTVKDKAIHFEAQRLINQINYRKNDAQLNNLLDTLYNFAAAHEKQLIEDDEQLRKIAQCIMGVKPKGLTNETQIIALNAKYIKAFYQHLNSKNWPDEKHQRFITFFALQYIYIGSVSKTEKLYRYFDSLFVGEFTGSKIKKFRLPKSPRFQNGTMVLTTKNWSSLSKNKIVVQPSSKDLFDFVYLVSLLRTVNRNYADEYDVVLLRSNYKEHQAYLGSVKQNLAFNDYYIATHSPAVLDSIGTLSPVFIVNNQNEVIYQANHTNSLFKKLNAVPEAEKEQAIAKGKKELAQRKNQIKLRALRTRDSINYQQTYQNIRFTLKGLWANGLNTQLTPVSWDKKDTIVDTTYPYMAKFEVINDQYKVYELLVLVTGKKQDITITSTDLHTKKVAYAKTKNAKFHKAIEAINKHQAKQTNYTYILKNYPFKDSKFMAHAAKQLETAKKQEQIAISSVKKASELLQRYAALKRDQVR